MNESERVALVTGANRGVGFYVCRDLARLGMKVILTARSETKGATAVDELAKEYRLDADFMHLDVSSVEMVENAAKQVDEKYGRLDVLINNAGVFVDHDWNGKHPAPETTADSAANLDMAIATNLRGPYAMIEAFAPLMKKRRYGRIVNISSILGQLNGMGGGYKTYKITKAALNAVTRIFAAELHGYGILVNSVCPGWRRTGMGGGSAPLAPDEGNETIIEMATLPSDGPTGMFYRNGEKMEW